MKPGKLVNSWARRERKGEKVRQREIKADKGNQREIKGSKERPDRLCKPKGNKRV
jgi:hypothetical protein